MPLLQLRLGHVWLLCVVKSGHDCQCSCLLPVHVLHVNATGLSMCAILS